MPYDNSPVPAGMKRLHGYVSTGLVGSEQTFSFDVDEDASDDAIEEAAREAMFECIEWSYYADEEKPRSRRATR